jgi:putative Mg2+ transporter-C (MgtC) family protein
MAPLLGAGAAVGVGESLLRLGLAVVLGGLIGLEREFHGRPAGLRTHIMVCLGATLLMLVALAVDPGRVAAGVVTGIGFLGAGAILHLKNTNRGLTTAACIWFVAALGVCIGLGSYWIAAVGTLLALIVLALRLRVEDWVHPDLYREVVVVGDREELDIGRVQTLLAELGYDVLSHDYEDRVAQGELEVCLDIRTRHKDVTHETLARLRALPGVRTITWRVLGRE